MSRRAVRGARATGVTLIVLLAACELEVPNRQTTALTLEAPATVGAGQPVTFRIHHSYAEIHSAEVVDQLLGPELLVVTASAAGSGLAEATWRPTVDDEGPYSLRAKLVLASGKQLLSPLVSLDVRVLETFSSKGPTGVVAAAEGTAIRLSWTTDHGASGYYVYRGTSPGLAPSAQDRVADVKDAGFLDTTPISGTTYTYVVTSYVVNKRSGRIRESTASTQVAATVGGAPPDSEAPLVGITAPAASTSYTAAQTVSIVASASDNVGVARVEFFDGSVLRGTATAAPYSYSWVVSAAENGTHSWTAKAYDAAGNSATSTPRLLGVQIATADTAPPAVSITAPATSPSYTAAQTVSIVASASDNVGVAKVEFFDGSVLRGTATATPYSLSWPVNAAANGTHSWTAKAYDAAGNSATSAPRLLTVSILTPPVAPSAVTATAGSGSNTISWSLVTGATSHDLIWSTTSGVTPATGTKIAGASSPYLHAGRVNGVTDYYVVVATNAAGTGPASAQVAATPQAAPDTVAPAFAGLTSATVKSASEIQLAWTAASDGVTPQGSIVYDIYKSATPAIDFAGAKTTTPPGATTSVVGGLAASTTFYFAVRARDAAGNQDPNNVVRSATTSAAAPVGPPAPFGSTVGVSAANFTIQDCAGNDFDLHSQYSKYPAVVVLFNWTGFT